MTDWRGVAAENRDDLDEEANVLLRARSRRLLGELLRPHRRAIALLVALIVVANAAGLAIPYLVKVGIDTGIPAGTRTLLLIVAAILGCAVTQALTRQAFLRFSGQIGQETLLELRRRVFKQFQRLSPAFHEKYTSGRVISRLTSDVEAIAELVAGGFDGLITAVLTLFGTAVMLLVLDVRLGLVALAPFPVLFLMARWFRRASLVTYRRSREAVAGVIVHFVESMTGIRAAQTFRREDRNQEIFEELDERYRAANLAGMRLIALFQPGVKLLGNVTIAAVLVYGGWLAIHGEVTVGVLAAFLLYLRQFYEPMQEISQFYNTLQSAGAALEKLSGVLEERPGVPEPLVPVALPAARGEVVFRDVRFHYHPDVPVLHRLDLVIPAGQTVAVVGATGAGKTTLAKLIARFYDPVTGAITLDGVDLRDLAEDELRRAVVMVTQENYLFGGSVADNIRFGRPSASTAEVEAAAAAVGVRGFVSSLDGETGKRGARMSAGQRQLVAFARVFLADPAVLILDEATSSLDVPSERLVQRALRTVLTGRTALIIAHRLSTVEIADRVLVIDGGRVVEDGPPGELIAASGRYAGLHQAWLESLT
ncbi:ABC transporter ATP-binding protein [Herbidospora galbida]|uniref:ABC transporter ATP-binding protein n=1 Tax=Herbidospora galbida TaxID=2575442 RepID=A0A4U3MGK6_9ACTN|nr:ABC transporter ATP-binding protein [Herbidospora galbida]TKK87930.1 ABC transporter ATP-binding protein [Herbidospora galbida]